MNPDKPYRMACLNFRLMDSSWSTQPQPDPRQRLLAFMQRHMLHAHAGMDGQSSTKPSLHCRAGQGRQHSHTHMSLSLCALCSQPPYTFGACQYNRSWAVQSAQTSHTCVVLCHDVFEFLSTVFQDTHPPVSLCWRWTGTRGVQRPFKRPKQKTNSFSSVWDMPLADGKHHPNPPHRMLSSIDVCTGMFCTCRHACIS